MNYPLVAKYLGYLALALGVLMLTAVVCAVFAGEWDEARGIALAAALCAVVGAVFYAVGRNATAIFYQREALGLVGLVWILAGLLGALPYVCTGVLSPVDAIFESVSGFTTTGASILTDVESLAASVLFWRSFTHWLGGMGIVLLFIAVLPYLGTGGKQLFRSESPGPDPHGLRPRIKESALILYKIYLGFTIAQILALKLAGMRFFDAICHTFGTVATAGFSTRNASIAAYDSVTIEVITIFFMVAAGANFGLYFAMFRGQWGAFLRDSEWRVYIALLVLCTVLITMNLALPVTHPDQIHVQEVSGEPVTVPDYTWGHALRVAAFQVVSINTTTGYGTDDFDSWPHFSRMLLVMLMFVGGCAGSTAGGMKVMRIIVLAKMAYQRVESTFRPKTVRALRVSGHVVDEDVQRMVSAFFILFFIWFMFGCLVMSALGLPFTTAVTAVIACLNNIGPGLGLVGSTMNYAIIPEPGKLFLSLCMILGRLELFSICVLLIPSFWRVGR
jgi:trk system potassium uptake protein TrkH